MEVDVVIVGGGIAGLWTLDHLRRQGYRAVLVENRALGYGQTVSSQGIIHGGLKYSLKGVLTASADEIREMPVLWRDCLSGVAEPNLSKTAIRSHSCYLWQTRALASQAGMLGAQLNLRVKPKEIPEAQRPEILRETPGHVYRLDEQVLSPASLLECFRSRLAGYLLKVDEAEGISLEQEKSGQITSVVLRQNGREMTVHCRAVVLSAGAGNALLSKESGREHAMQLRPLHMTLARGPLPMFQGHCIDGAKTRLTVTSDYLRDGRVVWQLGGNLAEQGTKQQPDELIRHAAAELQETLPAIDLDEVEFATYRIDRAEKQVRLGLRPDSPQILRHGNALTCWPTKLAFAPRCAERISAMLEKDLRIKAGGEEWTPDELADWSMPAVAASPWEAVETWYTADGSPVPGEFRRAS
ncbi:FAD-dependent oxidoreductase [Rubinisphaera margarita]|uniref:FAD-dependent oxidoreductase n=1 Tax=Rubinisphaera margarita TaxID=2909586 RepID=UPI001EE802E4|nr:FAD-dependent oxidoreductase [Rubinisphaera margarita]MCG6154916.1 FAD-dependent oxidoreductase [Rubinisphaera margarita]